MPALKQQFPNLKLWLHEQQTQVLLEKLRYAQLDVLILALPIDNHEFKELNLFKESFWLAVSKQHPLAEKKLIHLNDLNQQQVLLLEEGHCLRDHALDVCYMAGASEFTNFHATSLETLRHMVGEGMGITLLPELAILRYQNSVDNISYIPFAQPIPTRQIGMLFRKNSYREQTYQQIAKVIISAFAKKLYPNNLEMQNFCES